MQTSRHSSEREGLEILKLQQDLRHGTITLGLSILGSILLLVGLAIDRIKVHEQRKVENALRKRELELALFNQRKESYLALSDAACAIAACGTYDEVVKVAPEFQKLYYGRAHIVAVGDTNVVDAKIAFHFALLEYLEIEPFDTPDDYFGKLALDITSACRPNLDPRGLE